MKIKKKISKENSDLDSVIDAGKAKIEEPAKRRRGRPKSKVKKIQCPFYLPKGIVEAIDDNCRGNKSVFAAEVFKFYFDKNGINYRRE